MQQKHLDYMGRNMHWFAIGAAAAVIGALFFMPQHARADSCDGGIGHGKLSKGCVAVEAEAIAKKPSTLCYHGKHVSADGWRACTPGARFADDFQVCVHSSSTWLQYPDEPVSHFDHWGNATADASMARCYSTLRRSKELLAATHRRSDSSKCFSARSLGLPPC